MGKWLAQAHTMAARGIPANDAGPSTATPNQAAELRDLLAVVSADWPAHEQAEALAAALADPEAALTCFRTIVSDDQR